MAPLSMVIGLTTMTKTATLKSATRDTAPKPAAAVRGGDDKAMLKAAADLTRDLNVPRPGIYWADMIGSALLGYGALFAAMTINSTPVALLAGVVAVLA